MRKITNPKAKELSKEIAKRKIIATRTKDSLWDNLSYNDASVLYGALNIYTLNRNLPEDVRNRAERMKINLKKRLNQNGRKIRKIVKPSINS